MRRLGGAGGAGGLIRYRACVSVTPAVRVATVLSGRGIRPASERNSTTAFRSSRTSSCSSRTAAVIASAGCAGAVGAVCAQQLAVLHKQCKSHRAEFPDPARQTISLFHKSPPEENRGTTRHRTSRLRTTWALMVNNILILFVWVDLICRRAGWRAYSGCGFSVRAGRVGDSPSSNLSREEPSGNISRKTVPAERLSPQ